APSATASVAPIRKREAASAMPPSALESAAAGTPRRADTGCTDSAADTRAKLTRGRPRRNYMAGKQRRISAGSAHLMGPKLRVVPRAVWSIFAGFDNSRED